MQKRCLTCTYYRNNGSEEFCSKNEKPSLCSIRTINGVYNDIKDSNISYTDPFGNVYYFKSNKKLDVYLKIVETSLNNLGVIETQLQSFTDKKTRTFDFNNLVMLCYSKAYKEVANGKKQNYYHKKTKR